MVLPNKRRNRSYSEQQSMFNHQFNYSPSKGYNNHNYNQFYYNNSKPRSITPPTATYNQNKKMEVKRAQNISPPVRRCQSTSPHIGLNLYAGDKVLSESPEPEQFPLPPLDWFKPKETKVEKVESAKVDLKSYMKCSLAAASVDPTWQLKLLLNVKA